MHHLFPISSHPRSRPSAPAAEQLRFCNLALSLLDQASFHSAPVPLNVESILSSHLTPDETKDEESKPSAAPPHAESAQGRRKYALLQRLPTGDWWSSTNSSYPSLSLEGKDVSSLGTGHAELVAVFPSATVAPSEEQRTLGSYVKKRPPVLSAAQNARRLTCGKFLDYGPYASFAPTFDQDGVEVGQATLSEVFWYRQLDRRRRERVLTRRKQLEQQRQDEVAMDGVDEPVVIESPGSSSQDKIVDLDLESSLDGLLSPEQVTALKQALGSLELERAVDELLQRNARALARLEHLQAERLLSEGSTKTVDVGSEEWDTGTHPVLRSF